LLRFAVNLTPKRVANAVSAVEGKGKTATASSARVEAAPPKSAPAQAKRKKVGAKAKTASDENPQYPNALMDASLYRFLSISDPAQLEHVGPLPPGSRKPPEPLALSAWKTMHDADGVVVLKHPVMPGMYAICYRFAEADIRKLWEILVDITKRPSWDGMCEDSEQLLELGPRDTPTRPTKRIASVSWMGMKGGCHRARFGFASGSTLRPEAQACGPSRRATSA
jgi:hypothetical protein